MIINGYGLRPPSCSCLSLYWLMKIFSNFFFVLCDIWFTSLGDFVSPLKIWSTDCNLVVDLVFTVKWISGAQSVAPSSLLSLDQKMRIFCNVLSSIISIYYAAFATKYITLNIGAFQLVIMIVVVWHGR